MAYESEKHYADDWAKAKSRDLVGDLIKRTLLTFRKPKDLQVLCFPGIDAQEVFQVYDALGIPRQNIVGLERDPYIADEIEKKKLGIRVVRKSVEDFVESEESLPFDIVSLDYTGPISFDQVDTLKQIRAKQERKHWVLHNANLVKREGSESNLLYRCGFVQMLGSANILEDILNLKKDSGLIKPTEEKINKFQKLWIKGDRADTKEEGYSAILKATMLEPTDSELLRLLRYSCKPSKYEEFLSIIGTAFGVPQAGINEIERELKRDVYKLKIVEEMIIRNIGITLSTYKLDTSSKMLVATALFDHHKKYPFFKAKELVKYSYVSESGSPMIGDILFLSYPERCSQKATSLLETLGFPDEFKIKDSIEFDKRLIDYYKENKKFFTNTRLIDTTQRRFLGSSAKPILTKARAIYEMQAGLSDVEIAGKYRGVNGKPLPQWRAHLTMGTYDAQPRVSEETIQESPEDSTIEKISKEEAIDLLASGIPVNEIADTYPTSFTQGQLRAFKAHITMGTYQSDK